MLVKSYAAAVQGISATVVTIEVNCTKGIQFFLVGLPDVAVRESHERIISALQVSGYKFPRNRIVINMAPADIRKEGSSYDLPLAIGILAAAGELEASRLDQYMMMGELSLDGSLKPVKGILPIAIKAREEGFKGFIVPEQNAREAAVVNNLEVYGVSTIKEVIEFIAGKRSLEPTVVNTREEFYARQLQFEADFSDVRGQENVKRALEVAAAGSHNLILIGPPGSGKSMLAKRLPSILPPFTLQESLETTKIHSVAGKIGLNTSLMTQRPFRSPHHTISNVAMVEVMRQPLEDRTITVSRARFSVDYPANFMLVASMNPCPCGYYNHPDRPCLCSPGAVQKYMNRVSGPLLDRIDIQVEVVPVPFEKISEQRPSECSEAIRERVMKARAIQEKRFAGHDGIYSNAQMTSKLLHEYAVPDAAGLSLLKVAMQRLNLSARAYDRILKVSRTIADLEASPDIEARHLAEAINYRNLDRETWGT